MNLLDILLLAVGLSMDAFAVAVCKGLAMKRVTFVKLLIIGAWFGVFQAVMPLLGYFLASSFSEYIEAYSPVISCVLLILIGGNMIREAIKNRRNDECDETTGSVVPLVMLPLAVATSIDAAVSGITLAGGGINIILAVTCIGATTLVLSVAGGYIGSIFGAKYKTKAEIIGGVVLILLGVKVLLRL